MKKEIIVLSLVIVGSMTASAAIISDNNLSWNAAGSVNLTTQGTTDWVIWSGNSDNWTFPNSNYNNKAGVTSVISDPTIDWAGGVARIRWSDVTTWTYTDGVNPVSATGEDVNAVGMRQNNGGIGNWTGSFMEFDVTSVAGGVNTLYLYGETWRVGTKITASMTGATATTSTLIAAAGGDDWVYSVSYTPDTVGDVLTIRVESDGVAWSGQEANANNGISIAGAAVSVIPEPGSYALLAGCLGLVVAVTRRRK
mgnify:FL=1